jgi:hypothetical protein
MAAAFEAVRAIFLRWRLVSFSIRAAASRLPNSRINSRRVTRLLSAAAKKILSRRPSAERQLPGLCFTVRSNPTGQSLSFDHGLSQSRASSHAWLRKTATVSSLSLNRDDRR